MLDNYKDIVTEIELSKIRIQGLEEEQESIKKLMFSARPYEISGVSYSDMPGGSKDYTSFDRLWDRLRRIDNEILIEKDRIKIMGNTKDKMDKALEELQGLQYKIAYMRMQGYTLLEIADKLKYNESYIRRVAANIKKEC